MLPSIRISVCRGKDESERCVELVLEQDSRLDVTAQVSDGGDVRFHIVPMSGKGCGSKGKPDDAIENPERSGVFEINNRSAGRVGDFRNFALGGGVHAGHDTYLNRLVKIQNSQASTTLKKESSGGN